MKITPEDMDAVRDVLGHGGTFDRECETALALILVRIYDRGYAEGRSDEFDAQQHSDL